MNDRIPSKRPYKWSPDDYYLLLSISEYEADPTPKNRASILALRLTESLDEAEEPSYRNVALAFLDKPLFGRGAAIAKWSIRTWINTPTCESTIVGIAAQAKDDAINSEATGCLAALKNTPVLSWQHLQLAMRLTKNHPAARTYIDAALSMLNDDHNQMIRTQTLIWTHWLNDDDLIDQGCDFLSAIYDALTPFKRAQLLNALPAPSPAALLPLVAKQLHDHIPMMDQAILRACRQINSPKAEPIITSLLKSPHHAIALDAVSLTGGLCSRRALSDLDKVIDTHRDERFSNAIKMAKEHIESRHPAHEIEQGALSLSETVGTSGGLSLSHESGGGLTLDERIERERTQPAQSTQLEQTTITHWQHLAPTNRVNSKNAMGYFALTQAPGQVIKTIVIPSIFILIVTIFQGPINAQLGGLNGVVGIIVLITTIFASFNLSRRYEHVKQLVELLEHGQFAVAKFAHTVDPTKPDDQLLCVDEQGNEVIKVIPHKIAPSRSRHDNLPVLIGEKTDDVLLLDALSVQINDAGKIPINTAWTIGYIAIMFLVTGTGLLTSMFFLNG